MALHPTPCSTRPEMAWSVWVGEVPPGLGGVRRGAMRFYSGVRDGRMHHHDIALVGTPDLAQPDAPNPIGHVAIALPDRSAWLRQLAFLQSRGVAFEHRVEHGMTHSLYIRDPNGYSVKLLYELPSEAWEKRYLRRAAPLCGGANGRRRGAGRPGGISGFRAASPTFATGRSETPKHLNFRG